MSENTFGSGQANENALPDPSTLSYEQARDELVETVKILELGQMSLDESLRYWERGEALAKRCEVLLDRASRRVEDAISSRQGAAATGQGAESEQ